MHRRKRCVMKKALVILIGLFLLTACGKEKEKLVLVTEDRISRLISLLKDKGYIEVKYNYKECGKKITSRVITPLADKIGCYNDLMRIGESTNKASSKHQQPIGENAKDIYNNINLLKNYLNQFHF